MKIKHKIAVFASFALTFLFVSCNDDFMNRFPESTITQPNFFKTVNDLEVYTNGLYGTIGASYDDGANDNVSDNQGPDIYRLLRGEITPKTQGQWNWETLRTINFLIENSNDVVGDQVEINHYLGIARLFRAYHYYGKVRTYSDVPWYDRTLQTTDIELLYKPQDPRVMVVDKIMDDLDFATKHIKASSSKTRITKWSALGFQARIALEEGTFRKYHEELGLTDAKRFLEIARDATKEIFINNSNFSLFTEEKAGIHPYEGLFSSMDLSSNPEMIMYGDYDKGMGRFHNAQAMYNNYYGLSRDLMEDYLAIDGNKTRPFQEVSGYNKMAFTEAFKNRDPRILYTYMQPGDIRTGASKPTIPRFGIGGYVQVKFAPPTHDQIDWDRSYTDLPILRLAEVYLIYAEARAELGELTQDDLNKTVNLLRDRVKMPHATLSDWNSKIDPVQEKRYPNVSGTQRGAILELRRERRIELACEGFRTNDLYRWKAGKRFEIPFEGIYIKQLGYLDITGDGDPNIAIVKTQADADAIPDEDKQKYSLTIYILDGNTFYLSEGDRGHLRITAHKDKFKFNEPQYYYKPISEQDIVINENLYQNKYWTNVK